MAERTTQAHLEAQLRELCAVTNAPTGPIWQVIDRRTVATVGALYLDHAAAYGGWRVAQIISAQGGESSPLGDRRLPARHMWLALRAALGAIRLALGDAEYERRRAAKAAVRA